MVDAWPKSLIALLPAPFPLWYGVISLSPWHDGDVGRVAKLFGALAAGFHFPERLRGDRWRYRLRPMHCRLWLTSGQDPGLELFLLLLVGLLLG